MNEQMYVESTDSSQAVSTTFNSFFIRWLIVTVLNYAVSTEELYKRLFDFESSLWRKDGLVAL
jgi:hypothetical protein